MKAVVVSDSHKNFDSIMRIVERESPFSLLIHAGDVQQDVDDIRAVWPKIHVEAVVGNNDFCVMSEPYQKIVMFGGKKIFLTHGHMFRVKTTLSPLLTEGKKLGVDLCIFGHTHRAYLQEMDGVMLLNPGSSQNSYAMIDIYDGKIHVEIKEN